MWRFAADEDDEALIGSRKAPAKCTDALAREADLDRVIARPHLFGELATIERIDGERTRAFHIH